MVNAITTWETEPIPAERDDDFRRRYTLMSGSISFVELTVPGIPADVLNACFDLQERVRGTKDDPTVPRGAYLALAHVARVLYLLLREGEKVSAVQDDLRKAIATLALPDEAELKKLARYRKILEDGLQRRLAALEQLRKLSVAVARSDSGFAVTQRARTAILAARRSVAGVYVSWRDSDVDQERRGA